ncbi:hypothetical protein [Flavobacterium degerlachei]|nr:hypothetical protein [Flavobacterium degerlachei]
MEIEKTANHSHFFTKDRVVYEKLSNGETITIKTLSFYYPDWDILSEEKISYLNKHHEHFKEQEKLKEPSQMDLFG